MFNSAHAPRVPIKIIKSRASHSIFYKILKKKNKPSRNSNLTFIDIHNQNNFVLQTILNVTSFILRRYFISFLQVINSSTVNINDKRLVTGLFERNNKNLIFECLLDFSSSTVRKHKYVDKNFHP